MKLYLKQKVFSWGDRFRVCDHSGETRFYVEGEIFTLGKKLHIYDSREQEVACIQQRLLSFLPRFDISRNGQTIAEVCKQFTLFYPEYVVDGPGWTVEGDFWAHEYEITAGSATVASVSKQWLTWGDTYEIDVAPGADAVMALAVVLVIDATLEQAHNS